MTTRILIGDCRDVLDALPAESVQCCVTSPPYWGLRSYLPADHPQKHREIGSEATVDEWVDVMVDVFRRVRRVLRDDGVLFLNLGDAYAGGRRGPDSGSTLQGSRANQAESRRAQMLMTSSRRRDNHPVPRSDVAVAGCKPKDLMGQPWLVAFALRADGWYLRQEIIWHKPNPMPESARDRCTKAHEHVFLLSKSEQYFWNFDAVQEPVSGTANARRKIVPAGWAVEDVPHTAAAHQTAAAHRKTQNNGVGFGHGADRSERMGRGPGWCVKNNDSFNEAMAVMPDSRNPRSVWTIPTHGFKGAHFATFPPELARRCIVAGSREGDVVLDPFGGSGTVGMVADQLQRSAILIDLDERNGPMATERIVSDAPLLAQVVAA